MRVGICITVANLAFDLGRPLHLEFIVSAFLHVM